MAGFSSIKNFLSRLKEKSTQGNLAGIADDIRFHYNYDTMTSDSFSPDAIKNWINTRIFGTRVPNEGGSIKWEANTGKLNTAKDVLTNKWLIRSAVGGYAAYKTLGGVDRVAGFLHGGPGYGGYIGFGEGGHSETNALQGARANMNYQAQMMGLQALSANQIAPQYSFDIAPMRQRRSGAALRNSTEGLTLGLHKGRHGGY